MIRKMIDPPQHLFGHVSLVPLVLVEHALQVAVGCKLHDNIERLLLYERGIVADDMLVIEATEHENFHQDLTLPLR